MTDPALKINFNKIKTKNKVRFYLLRAMMSVKSPVSNLFLSCKLFNIVFLQPDSSDAIIKYPKQLFPDRNTNYLSLKGILFTYKLSNIKILLHQGLAIHWRIFCHYHHVFDLLRIKKVRY